MHDLGERAANQPGGLRFVGGGGGGFFRFGGGGGGGGAGGVGGGLRGSGVRAALVVTWASSVVVTSEAWAVVAGACS